MTTWKRFLVWSHAEVSSFLNRNNNNNNGDNKKNKNKPKSRPLQQRGFTLGMNVCCGCVQMEERMRSKQSWLYSLLISTSAFISLTVWKQGITGEAVVAQACNPSCMNTLELLHDYYLWAEAFLNTE